MSRRWRTDSAAAGGRDGPARMTAAILVAGWRRAAQAPARAARRIRRRRARPARRRPFTFWIREPCHLQARQLAARIAGDADAPGAQRWFCHPDQDEPEQHSDSAAGAEGP